MRAHGAQTCVVSEAMNCSHWRGIGLADLWLLRCRVARCSSSQLQRSAGQSNSGFEHLSTHHALLLARPPTAFCGGPTHTGVQPLRCAARLDAGWSRVEAGSGVARSGSCVMTSGIMTAARAAGAAKWSLCLPGKKGRRQRTCGTSSWPWLAQAVARLCWGNNEPPSGCQQGACEVCAGGNNGTCLVFISRCFYTTY